MGRPRDSTPSDTDENAGRYRIQAVAQMTGVSAATLRAWERRYGLPVPKRTSSSYRLYSDHDIELVRRVRQLCDEGMAPSQAAREVIAQRDPPPVAPTVIAPPAEDVYQLAIARILRVQADEIRDKRRLRAEERAMKLPVKLIFPLILCILPALFAVVIGPAVVSIVSNGGVGG